MPIIYRAVRSLIFCLAALAFFGVTAFCQPYMYAHYIDVGQGSATLLEFPCGAVLIDAGAQDQANVSKLLTYLDEFFRRRTDLNNTFAVLFVTHDHPDHAMGLREVNERFQVLRYVDNGQYGKKSDARWMRDNYNTDGRHTVIREVPDEEITSLPQKTGLTDAIIDPLMCSQCDPVIKVLSGGLSENPGWSESAFDNKNNQSLVVRVDFGESSFLTTGDLEQDGIETMLSWYDGETILDADVLQIGHHGSYNATTAPLLEAVTPDVAVIPCGHWDYGQGSKNKFTTYAYGHPRKSVLELLAAVITVQRSQKIVVKAAEDSRDFRDVTVRKKIYSTAWDGNIKIKADLSGNMTVSRNN